MDDTITHVCQVVVHVYGTRIRRLMHETAPEFADVGAADASYGRLVARRGDLPRTCTVPTEFTCRHRYQSDGGERAMPRIVTLEVE